MGTAPSKPSSPRDAEASRALLHHQAGFHDEPATARDGPAPPSYDAAVNEGWGDRRDDTRERDALNPPPPKGTASRQAYDATLASKLPPTARPGSPSSGSSSRPGQSSSPHSSTPTRQAPMAYSISHSYSGPFPPPHGPPAPFSPFSSLPAQPHSNPNMRNSYYPSPASPPPTSPFPNSSYHQGYYPSSFPSDRDSNFQGLPVAVILPPDHPCVLEGHEPHTSFGILGLLSAVFFFPVGIAACLIDRRVVCKRCGGVLETGICG